MKRKSFRYSPPGSAKPEVLKEAAMLQPPPAPLQINVRAAKDNLSNLLEQASIGHEIIITSDGKPKAKLVPVQTKRKRFKVDWERSEERRVGKEGMYRMWGYVYRRS